MSKGRDTIIAAATELFAERPFDQVTIRDIAARADLSPGMVMKCGGSKKDLFYEVAKVEPLPLPDVADSDFGEALVRDVLDRSSAGAVEPLGRAIMLRLTAPDRDDVRARFVAGYLEPIAEKLGGTDDAVRRAELVVSALLGLAASVRVFELPVDRANAVHRYGAIVQQLLFG